MMGLMSYDAPVRLSEEMQLRARAGRWKVAPIVQRQALARAYHAVACRKACLPHLGLLPPPLSDGLTTRQECWRRKVPSTRQPTSFHTDTLLKTRPMHQEGKESQYPPYPLSQVSPSLSLHLSLSLAVSCALTLALVLIFRYRSCSRSRTRSRSSSPHFSLLSLSRFPLFMKRLFPPQEPSIK